MLGTRVVDIGIVGTLVADRRESFTGATMVKFLIIWTYGPPTLVYSQIFLKILLCSWIFSETFNCAIQTKQIFWFWNIGPCRFVSFRLCPRCFWLENKSFWFDPIIYMFTLINCLCYFVHKISLMLSIIKANIKLQKNINDFGCPCGHQLYYRWPV